MIYDDGKNCYGSQPLNLEDAFAVLDSIYSIHVTPISLEWLRLVE